MTIRRRAWLALALVSARALSGCAQTGPATAPPDVAPVLGSVCAWMERCPGELPPIASRSRAECVDILYWALTCRADDDGVTRVPLSVEGPTAEACAAFFDGLACGGLSCLEDGSCPEAAPCAELFSGLGDDDDDDDDVVGPGERCSRYGTPRCDSEHYCAPEAYDPVNGVMLCEVCVPRLGAGETCDPYVPSPECAAGLACVRDVADGTTTCQTTRTDGEPCTDAQECASEYCASGGVCLGGGHEGDPCAENRDCRPAESLICLGGTCIPIRRVGETCDELEDCAVRRCHSDGICGVPDGESCSSNGDCRTGYCPGRTVCSPLLADGASCTAHTDCQGGHCDSATGRCAPPPPAQPVGGSCTDASQCEEGLACSGTCYHACSDAPCPAGLVCLWTGSRQECVAPMPDGSSCDDDEECASGFCSGSEVCAVRPGVGDPCSDYGDCYPWGLCSGGVCVERAGPDEACTGYDSCLHPFYCREGRCTLISLACEPAPIGQECTFFRFCAPDAYCDLAGGIVCRARHGVGEPCSMLLTRDGDDCAPGLHCAYDDPEGPTCRERIPAGDACTAGDVCAAGTYCIAGTCTESPGGGECHWDADCPLQTYCDEGSETCEPFRQLGDACARSDYRDRCDPRFVCDSTSATCVERPGIGEPCDRFGAGCREGALCSDETSTCIARAGAGAPCTTSSDDNGGCLETLRCDTSASPSVCVPRLALGEECDSGDECISRICDDRCLARAECVLPGTL